MGEFKASNIGMLVARVILSFALCGLASAFTCQRFDSLMGATFDLTDLQRTPGQPSYVVEDGDIPCTTYVEQNYTYVFNVCGAVADGVPTACQSMNGLSTAAVLQVDKRITTDPSDDWCYVVGAYSEATTKVGLLDSQDPTKGISVTYYGDYCQHPTKVQRQLTVELSCADKLNPVPTHAMELSHCVYSITMPSVYGCPLECPVGQRKLCGGNGHCAYDADKMGARCFCNHGYEGADCLAAQSAVQTPLNYSPVLLGLIITIFIIITILVGSIVLMIRQVSAYREDIANYQVLKGDEDGSAVV